MVICYILFDACSNMLRWSLPYASDLVFSYRIIFLMALLVPLNSSDRRYIFFCLKTSHLNQSSVTITYPSTFYFYQLTIENRSYRTVVRRELRAKEMCYGLRRCVIRFNCTLATTACYFWHSSGLYFLYNTIEISARMLKLSCY